VVDIFSRLGSVRHDQKKTSLNMLGGFVRHDQKRNFFEYAYHKIVLKQTKLL
jgi:hypothetical protein